MDGYDERTYGDAFADVYDDWYADVSDIDSTVATLLELTEGRAVLELGVGTGRIAVPLALAGRDGGVVVTGVDTSPAMLARLRERDEEGLVEAMACDMRGPLPAGPFGVVAVAYNTLFNLTSDAAQRECFAAVSGVLAPGGRFVVEAFVPADDDRRRDDVSVRSMSTDRVVLSVSVRDPDQQLAEGQFVEFSERSGLRLRPWSIRYSTPAELDDMAAGAGLRLEHRWASFGRDSFGPDADRHVSVYRLG